MHRLQASAVLLFSFAMCSACTSDDDGHDDEHSHGGEGGEHSTGGLCCEIGAICHEAGEPSRAEIQRCHDLGHEGNEEACREGYDACVLICEGLTDNPVEHACE